MFTVSIVTSVILKRLLGLGPKVAEIFTYLPVRWIQYIYLKKMMYK